MIGPQQNREAGMTQHCPVTGDPEKTCDCGACGDRDEPDPFSVPFLPPPGTSNPETVVEFDSPHPSISPRRNR